MHNVYLFQPQYAAEFRGEKSYFFPYSAGCLWSYVSQFEDIKNNFELKDIIFRREPPEEILARLDNPAVCGFSCYIWNRNYCLTVAEMIKERWPNCVIQFGGAESNGKLIKHSFVDTVIMGEGEKPFLESLRLILDNKPPMLFHEKRRLEDLNIPSPYTSGIFDKIINDNPDAKWSMIIETNRGCPYACTFCDWGAVTYSKVKKFELERIRADLEWAVDKPVTYLLCADANFGIFKERDLEIARMIKSVADRGSIDAVNLQYAKNSTSIVFDIAKTIGNLSRGITVSVQSMNDFTLDAIKRKNLDINNVRELMKLSEQHGVLTYTEVIIGLPLETLESWKQGFNNILEMGQHNSIDMWFAQLLENSELAQPESRQKYGIRTTTANDYLSLYNPNDWRGMPEQIELVCATNTMSTEELIEGYMYGWMIIHFHTGGYSQWISRYCFNRKNISYREFYDKFFELVQESDAFKDHFNKIKNTVDLYIRNGKLPIEEGNGGHNIHAASYEFMYLNKNHIFQLAKTCAEHWGLLDPEIEKLQTGFIFDEKHTYPISVNLDFDIVDWESNPTTYTLEPQRKLDITKLEFYHLRRQGLIKNKIQKS